MFEFGHRLDLALRAGSCSYKRDEEVGDRINLNEENNMKREALTAARNWLLASVLLAGFVYSVFALTLNAKPAYASSCDCTLFGTEYQEAVQYCNGRGVEFFDCPYTCGQDTCWSATCHGYGFIVEHCSST